MPAHNKHKSINLLIREGFEYSTTGKLLHWLLTAGRTIVILTELVVIIAFLSRFWLDRSLTDISAQNNSRRLQIESSQVFEEDFRSAQERIGLIKKITAANNGSAAIIKLVSSLLPGDVITTDIIVTEADQLVIRGVSATETGVAGLMSSLGTSKRFKNVSLTDVNLDTQGNQVIKFAIKADLLAGNPGGN